MTSAAPGTSTSAVEVTHISRHGIWLLLDNGEHFLSFDAFPWFRDATVRQIHHVEMPHPDHLYWPELDVDLSADAIAHPERYPLVSRREVK